MASADRDVTWVTVEDHAMEADVWQQLRVPWEHNKSQRSMVAADHLKRIEALKSDDNPHPFAFYLRQSSS